jgi:hypothetical protein
MGSQDMPCWRPAASVITLSAFAQNAYAALACFAIAYGSLAFAGAVFWSLPGDVAPTPGHVASIGGIQHFASNLTGILTTTFTGIMPHTRGSERRISPTNVMLPDLLPTTARVDVDFRSVIRDRRSRFLSANQTRSDNFLRGRRGDGSLALAETRCTPLRDPVPSGFITLGSGGPNLMDVMRSAASEATQWETAYWGALECYIQIVVSWVL